MATRTKTASRALEKPPAPTSSSISGPPTGRATRTPSRWKRLQQHPLVGATPEQLHSILLDSESGRMARYQDLLDDMAERDERVGAVATTRALALAGKRWSVAPPRGFGQDKEALRVAEGVSDILARSPSFPRLVADLATGILRAYSVVENEWGRDSDGRTVPMAWHWLHPTRFAFDDTLELRHCERSDVWPGRPLSDYGPDKFIIHSPTAGWATYGPRKGALRRCIFPSFTKRFGIRWWLVGAERFGNPAPFIKMATGNEELVDDAKEMLKALTVDWQAVIDEAMELDTVPGSGTYTGEIHGRLVDLSNTSISIAVLGQNLSTEVSSGGSYAAGKSQETVRQDYLAADALELAATLRTQLIEPIVRYNWPGAPVPEFEFQLIQKQAKEIFAYHIEAGVVTVDEVRESLGLAPLPDGQGAKLIIPATFGATAQAQASAQAAKPFATPPPTLLLNGASA